MWCCFYCPIKLKYRQLMRLQGSWDLGKKTEKSSLMSLHSHFADLRAHYLFLQLPSSYILQLDSKYIKKCGSSNLGSTALWEQPPLTLQQSFLTALRKHLSCKECVTLHFRLRKAWSKEQQKKVKRQLTIKQVTRMTKMLRNMTTA